MAVTFTSATNRRVWQSSLLASALWIGVAIALGHWFQTPRGEPWILAGIFYTSFVALSIVWWLTRALITWLVWRIIWRKASTNNLIASFEKQQLPKPPANLFSAEDWFEDIVGREDAPVEQGLAAGGHYLRIHEFAREQGLIGMMRAKAVYEDAIAGYRATFHDRVP